MLDVNAPDRLIAKPISITNIKSPRASHALACCSIAFSTEAGNTTTYDGLKTATPSGGMLTEMELGRDWATMGSDWRPGWLPTFVPP